MPVLATGLILLIWSLGFGAVSRQFEMQADLFGARSVTPEPEECDLPCLVHKTEALPAGNPLRQGKPLCASAAESFRRGVAPYRLAQRDPDRSQELAAFQHRKPHEAASPICG